MSFQMVTSGAGWRLAGSLIQLGHEVAATYPQATCLGTVGNSSHEAEGDLSDHNPIVKDPRTGLGIVRAIDIGGPDSMLKAIRQRVWALYAEQDPRLWMYGYSKGTSDNLVNDFGLPFKTHVDDGDAGHLHISVTQSHYPSVASGYLSAIDSTAPWGFGAVLSGGGVLESDVAVADDVWNEVIAVPELGAGVQDTARNLLAAIRAMLGDIENKEDTLIGAVKTAATPVIDYTQLAAALIAQLKAA